MKSCPVCHAVYDDSMNYCLDHGTTLVGMKSEDLRELTNRDTAQYSSPDVEAYGGTTSGNMAATAPLTMARNSGRGMTYALLGLIAFMIVGGVTFVGGFMYLASRSGTDGEADPPRGIPLKTPTPRGIEGVKLRVDFTEEISKSSYTGTFRKALITNESSQAALRPSVSFGFFKGDVKVDSSVSRLGMEVLRPGETMPVWVRVDTVKPFDRIEAVQGMMTDADKKTLEQRFIELPIVESKLTTKTGTSLVNFKPVREPYYDIDGVVENNTATAANIIIYAIYYDKNRNIVGFASDSPDEMKPGQKSSFDISTSRNQIYGDATDYKLVMIAE